MEDIDDSDILGTVEGRSKKGMKSNTLHSAKSRKRKTTGTEQLQLQNNLY